MMDAVQRHLQVVVALGALAIIYVICSVIAVKIFLTLIAFHLRKSFNYYDGRIYLLDLAWQGLIQNFIWGGGV